jgi:predicted amidohydrolase
MNVTVAAIQYGVEFLSSWPAYTDKMETLVAQAAEQGAQILVFSEYGCLELASLFAQEVYSDWDKTVAALQEILPNYLHLHCNLAQRYGVYIVASTIPVTLADGACRNRAYFCRPDGSYGYQDKIVLTRYEDEVWRMSYGDEIKVFNTSYGLVGINICYDAEFPLVARRQVEMGAKIILVPSDTDTLSGYNRVRIGCQARALENQCYVVMAPTVGNTDWSSALDYNIGAAAIYTPVDAGFPVDGVLAYGDLNHPQWVIAQLDLAKIDDIRRNGAVLNYRDWDRQVARLDKLRAPLPTVAIPAAND